MPDLSCSDSSNKAKEVVSFVKNSLQEPGELDKLREINGLNQDNKDRAQDRDLKKLYAKRMIHVLISQLLIMNLIIIGVGFRWIYLENWVLSIFMSGTLAEVFGIVLIITKSLFPQNK